MSNWRSRLAPLGLAAVLVIASCGGDDDTADSTDDDAPTASDDAATAPGDTGTAETGGDSETAATGGTIRIVVTAEPRSLNQAIDNNSSAVGISKLVLERLVSIDGETSEPTPGLVKSWKQTNDTTWNLTLTKGVTFTNGEPFDAEVAAFSILDLRDTPGAYSPYMQVIEDAKALPNGTVEVTTTDPIGYLPALLTIVPAVPPKAYAETEAAEFGRKPIGTGPFVLDSWASGERMTLSRNDDYWGKKPSIDGLDITWNGEADTRVALLESGEADIVKSVPPQYVDQIDSADGLSIAGVDSEGVIVLQPNRDVPPFDDVRVRQALAHAIDREAIAETIFGGTGATPYANLYSERYESSGEYDGMLEYDPEAAKALLDEAGNPSIEFYWPNGRYTLDNQVGEAVAGMLEDAGFEVERKPMEAGAYFELLLRDDMPGVHMISVGPQYPHESYIINSFFLPDSVVTYCANENLVKPATEALSLDGAERAAAYSAIEEQLLVEDVCPVPLYVERMNWGVSDTVKGFSPRSDEAFDLVDVTVGS